LRIATCQTRLLLLALLLLASSYGTAGFVVADAQRLARAVEYLRTVAYNSTLHLCREAPHAAPKVYWIASDNLLAYKALNDSKEPNDSDLASTIRSRVIEIGKEYKLPVSADGVPLSLRYDVVMRDDATLEIPPRNMTHMTLYNGSYVLRYDIANGTGKFEDWREYADLLLLVALSNHNRGDQPNAIGNFTLAEKMWDGIGLRDKAYNQSYGEGQDPRDGPHAYATYKLGLLLYVSGKLRVHLPFEQDIVQRIWLMQNQTSGGIFTHIMPNGTQGHSDTNTETTAFVILGMTAIVPPSVPGFSIEAIVVGLLAGLALTLVTRGRSVQLR
jgi:hypothetical protein